MNDFLNDWGLSLMVFLPLAGALVMMLIPKAEEQLHKVVALVTTLASAAVGIAAAGRLRLRPRPASCSSSSTRVDRRSSTARYIVGHRRHLAAAARC